MKKTLQIHGIKRVLMVSSFVDLSRNVIAMRVINVGDKVRTIKEGKVLATYIPVTCINQNCDVAVAQSSDALVSEILQSAKLNAKLQKGYY